MIKLAAIDVGSNAMRMIIGTITPLHTIAIIKNVRESVRLGEDVFTLGYISENTMNRALEAFLRFSQAIKKQKVTRIKAVGTSATREASNRDIFIDRIAQASGIEITPIGPEEEARLVFLRVSQKLNLRNKVAMLIDIGGGSVEIAIAKNGELILTESFNMGTVRLLQKLDNKKRGQKQFHHLVEEYVEATKRRIKKQLGNKKIDLCIGTGGNVETLGDLRKLFFGKNKQSITQSELITILHKLESLPFSERIKQLKLKPDRADVIIPAGIVLKNILEATGIKKMLIPHVGLKDGLLVDMLQELDSKEKCLHCDQVLTSALQLGRKYSFDEQHGLAVARFAIQIFDETRFLHNLDEESRLLLEVAAMLHDIGHFISVTGHHRHTFYLLSATPIIGLSDSQRAIVANVARYHRKSPPAPQHESYQSLPQKDRVVVSKLSAILRLADAIDTEHAGKVTSIRTKYEKPYFSMWLQGGQKRGKEDLLLERWALLKRAPVFEDVFSVKFSLTK